jgi:hypothetical protein
LNTLNALNKLNDLNDPEHLNIEHLGPELPQTVNDTASDGRYRSLFVCVMLGKYDQHEL